MKYILTAIALLGLSGCGRKPSSDDVNRFVISITRDGETWVDVGNFSVPKDFAKDGGSYKFRIRFERDDMILTTGHITGHSLR